MTKPNRLNILIGCPLDDMRTPYGRFTGLSVIVREGYSPLSEQAQAHAPAADHDPEGRPYYVPIPMKTVWDATAINNAGRPGGFRADVDVPAIERAVATLRAAWGDIPVQDNSGRCAHLATAVGVLKI